MKACIVMGLLVSLVVAGCSEDKESVSKATTMPEVNDENCTTENIRAMPSNIQQEFSGLCLRRSNYKESDAQEW